MNKIALLALLTQFVAGFALTAAHAETPVPAQTMTPRGNTQPIPTPTLGDNFTQVLSDRRVTFRLLAPKAAAVDVLIGLKSGSYEAQGTTTAALTKDSKGLWSVTLGPFEPNLYEYQFSLDGRKFADPGNEMPKPQRQVDTSLLLIPGTPPDFLDVQNGAHGTVHDETYYSTTLRKNRRVLVYTPPNCDRSHVPFPVLYLYHGFWDTRYSWITEGRLAQILDNLLAVGKAVPMIVIVPEAHALPPETTQAASPDLVTNVIPYLTRNQEAVDEELFHDIIPLIQSRYPVSDEPQDRAIAGQSMGGLQAIETGIVHLGYFGWIGAFSPGIISEALSDEFINALKNSNEINESLSLFDITTGEKDELVGKYVTEFEERLKQANVQHTYTIVPDGSHSMFVWRLALYNFLQQVFKR